jgi:glycine/D-amino acid oxidase-like deaminating enzyme
MQADYLIIGSGIAGTLLAYELLTKGKSVIVIDDDSRYNASTVAGAVINPVNIKQWSIAKDYKQYVSQALYSYNELQSLLNIPIIDEVSIITFDDYTAKDDEPVKAYVRDTSVAETALINTSFNSFSPAKKISPSWQIHATSLLSAWKKYLLLKNAFLNDYFDATQLIISSRSVIYKNIKAEKIVFCEGASGVNNPFFTNLPFTRNRGEALLLSIPDLSQHFIYHKGIRLIPSGNHLFWCGSNYSWNYSNLDPDIQWQKQTTSILHQWLKLPFSVEKHIVAERPTTAGQIPLMLINEQLPAAMFNGLGTKGFLMAPLLAKQFAERLIGYKV